MLEINVLGPMEATGAGRCIAPTAAKPRQVLALLALRAGEVVSVSTLVEEIWGEKPPRSALTTLQTYILQLRRLIGRVVLSGSAKDVLLTRYNGYLFAPEAVMVDAQLYDGLVDEANQASENGDHVEAYRVARQALDLWSGDALIDVLRGVHLSIEATRLEQSRLGLLETRIAAELHLGRHHMLLGELAVLVARNPMHENFCAKLMIALYRSGQRWRALEVYQRVRSELADELGLEPSARLQQLQHGILSADPALDFVAPTTLFTQPT
ncbi:AfsR/SARP family transcriptional regulator [Streptomyces sp. AK04-3B]|uniref:AfsR/SARP family transcriptional regulator n=1 Tax=unclassified Streptomyces TaxID=2593676 RepID=UPI0029BFD219|nr:AfsR/SARP family transcriptional regulator [Streptomyces sp. AK04-3B]